MISARVLSTAIVAAVLVAAPVHAQVTPRDSVLYDLASPPSQFEWGCFGPCACPILVQSPLTGTFLLRESHSDPLYTYYDVLDVNWKSSNNTTPLRISGSGTYRRGGEVTVQEQLTLDLSFNEGPIQHFDSGLRSPGAPFPEIRTRISLHDEFCHDSVVAVDAKPRATTTGVDIGSRRPSLSFAPNPFVRSMDIAFMVPDDGRIDLAVFDLRGRRVRRLVSDEWLIRGAHTRSWDGIFDNRLPAPPGMYFVRLDSAQGRTIRSIVKLD